MKNTLKKIIILLCFITSFACLESGQNQTTDTALISSSNQAGGINVGNPTDTTNKNYATFVPDWDELIETPNFTEQNYTSDDSNSILSQVILEQADNFRLAMKMQQEFLDEIGEALLTAFETNSISTVTDELQSFDFNFTFNDKKEEFSWTVEYKEEGEYIRFNFLDDSKYIGTYLVKIVDDIATKGSFLLLDPSLITDDIESIDKLRFRFSVITFSSEETDYNLLSFQQDYVSINRNSFKTNSLHYQCSKESKSCIGQNLLIESAAPVRYISENSFTIAWNDIDSGFIIAPIILSDGMITHKESFTYTGSLADNDEDLSPLIENSSYETYWSSTNFNISSLPQRELDTTGSTAQKFYDNQSFDDLSESTIDTILDGSGLEKLLTP
jgi:hypothetical protein